VNDYDLEDWRITEPPDEDWDDEGDEDEYDDDDER